MQKPDFYYVSAPIGSGKTQSIINLIESQADTKAVIATQLTDLSKETSYKLEAKGVKTTVISSRDSKNVSCRKQYEDALLEYETPVILINQQIAYDAETFTSYRDLYIDEVPEIYERLSLPTDFGLSRKIIAELFSDTSPVGDTGYIQINLTADIASIAAGNAGSLFDNKTGPIIKEIANLICSAHHDVHVSHDQWQKLQDGELRKSLVFHVVRQSSSLHQYRSVTILAANFENSLPYKVWSDVNWQEDQQLRDRLRYQSFGHKAHNIELFYLTDEHSCSTYTFTAHFGKLGQSLH